MTLLNKSGDCRSWEETWIAVTLLEYCISGIALSIARAGSAEADSYCTNDRKLKGQCRGREALVFVM